MKFYPVTSRVHRFALLGIGLLGCTLASATRANLDLSPQEESSDLEGTKISQLVFNTGSRLKASYQPPRGWKYSGGSDYLDLQPNGMAQVKARVSKLPAPAASPFDSEGRKGLTEKVIRSLPEGSEDVKILAEELNPLQIDGKQTYLVELSYTYYGERYACYTLFLERAPEMLSFRLSCRESNYQTLREEFRRSLYTWQNL
ncbi:MAG TPA: hypothetical protein VGL24_00050 [Chthoniobacterales bacterium]